MFMTTPSVDIIVPVWNNPAEARACLSSIVSHSAGARLIIVDNGSDRQTQQVLEEFAEPLGERCLFLSTDRNEGLVRAINRGLARSDNEISVIVRPHVTVTKGWLSGLIKAAGGGIGSPVFSGNAPFPNPLARGRVSMETCRISFSTMAIKSEVHMLCGGFDDQLDGGEWCLNDYVSRAGAKGYRTRITSGSTVVCGTESLLGSETRRREQARVSQAIYTERWGTGHQYCVYFGRGVDTGSLDKPIETILDGARRGNRFTLLLHHRQAKEFERLGWDSLHTSIELHTLSRLMPRRDLRRVIESQSGKILVQGAPEVAFDSAQNAISFDALARKLAGTLRHT